MMDFLKNLVVIPAIQMDQIVKMEIQALIAIILWKKEVILEEMDNQLKVGIVEVNLQINHRAMVDNHHRVLIATAMIQYQMVILVEETLPSIVGIVIHMLMIHNPNLLMDRAHTQVNLLKEDKKVEDMIILIEKGQTKRNLLKI